MTVEDIEKTSTGIEGLDLILDGGFPKDQFILIQGGPGTGKTTLCLQFLLEGAKRGERGLYISLLHNRRDVQRIARSHGLSLEGIEVEELSQAADAAGAACEQTLFHSAHVEMSETIGAIREIVERVSPQRLVFDSISELQVLADTVFRCRQQVVSLKRLLARKQCTSLFTIGGSSGENGEEFQNLVDGLVQMEQASPGYGLVRRSLEVIKMRGMRYRSGRHDYRIETGGLEIYPRLQAFTEHADRGSQWEESDVDEEELLKTGVHEFDTLLGGGLEPGTATLFLGAAGVGKSTLSMLFAYAAARQGKKSTIFLFDENIQTYCRRARGIGIDICRFIKEGLVSLRRISVGEISPGEFSETIRKSIEYDGTKVLIIDTLTGYMSAMAQVSEVLTQLHELLAYTGNQGVFSFILVEEHGLLGVSDFEPHSTTLLADTVLLLRYFEAHGRIHRALSVFKKRYGDHEKTIREFRIASDGIKVGKPLEHLAGVLSGIPSLSGGQSELMATESESFHEEG